MQATSGSPSASEQPSASGQPPASQATQAQADAQDQGASTRKSCNFRDESGRWITTIWWGRKVDQTSGAIYCQQAYRLLLAFEVQGHEIFVSHISPKSIYSVRRMAAASRRTIITCPCVPDFFLWRNKHTLAVPYRHGRKETRAACTTPRDLGTAYHNRLR